jgi:CheY-like chemotaxis protein
MSTTPIAVSMRSALVIDDDVLSLVILRKNLAQIGIFDIVMAGNGREAVRALNAMPSPPDFLICDIFMPDMDGIEFIGELVKRNYQGALVLVTGLNSVMLEVASDIATSSGLNLLGCLTKPVLAQNLREVLGLAPTG